jgi:hypothetical protein
MKKISVITAIGVVLFSLQTVSAQQAEEALPTTKTEASINQDDYKQIKINNLSEIIKAAVEKDYPKASIAEAYGDKVGNYKLILAIGKDTKTVYTNARGDWFDPNKKG